MPLRPAEPLVVAPREQPRASSHAEAKQVESSNAETAVGLQAVRQRASSWLQARRGIVPKASAPAPSSAPPSSTQALVCMRVEPQDVMMLETVKERHLRKHVAEEQESNGTQQPHKSTEAEETTENSTSAVERTEEERDETPQRSDDKPDDPQNAESTTSPSP